MTGTVLTVCGAVLCLAAVAGAVRAWRRMPGTEAGAALLRACGAAGVAGALLALAGAVLTSLGIRG